MLLNVHIVGKYHYNECTYHALSIVENTRRDVHTMPCIEPHHECQGTYTVTLHRSGQPVGNEDGSAVVCEALER